MSRPPPTFCGRRGKRERHIEDADSEESWFSPWAPAQPRFRGGGRMLSRALDSESETRARPGDLSSCRSQAVAARSGAPKGACWRAQQAAFLACWYRLGPAPLRERRGLARPQTKRSTSCARSLQLRFPRSGGTCQSRQRVEVLIGGPECTRGTGKTPSQPLPGPTPEVGRTT